ncbi:hypothetical protein [Acinetobacter colistiniresistens]|uniref:hypothetical protein n=1 Tax=Acinetobacter colistiniresistens TaxID=280145 RepID=UPI001250BACD|nr:hypothetical protein [Acinetobacter colistiniresistens]
MKFIKWLWIRKGTKIVTVDDDPIMDVQTVMYKRNGLIFTAGWGGKIGYRLDDIRIASRSERRIGKKRTGHV